ncbi:hypothetical protein PUN28_009420 [Cardiocondyla obscurior]|uniref:Uncharacterized protein n=1 Tax=Cardiocondyla obscurior TaxID=286306 RepID=A0AAW2FRY8_9HYME
MRVLHKFRSPFCRSRYIPCAESARTGLLGRSNFIPELGSASRTRSRDHVVIQSKRERMINLVLRGARSLVFRMSDTRVPSDRYRRAVHTKTGPYERNLVLPPRARFSRSRNLRRRLVMLTTCVSSACRMLNRPVFSVTRTRPPSKIGFVADVEIIARHRRPDIPGESNASYRTVPRPRCLKTEPRVLRELFYANHFACIKIESKLETILKLKRITDISLFSSDCLGYVVVTSDNRDNDIIRRPFVTVPRELRDSRVIHPRDRQQLTTFTSITDSRCARVHACILKSCTFVRTKHDTDRENPHRHFFLLHRSLFARVLHYLYFPLLSESPRSSRRGLGVPLSRTAGLSHPTRCLRSFRSQSA